MTQFALGQPISTDSPQITVDAGLEPGRHRFGLVVVGSSGNTSASAEALITVSAAIAGPATPVGPATPAAPNAPAGPLAAPPRNEESPP